MRWYSEKSSERHIRLRKKPQEWFAYHSLFEKSKNGFPNIPLEQFIENYKKINKKLTIGDFGCGTGQVGLELSNQHNIYSFDHVAYSDHIISCDISKVPVGNNYFDVALMSLSLMGENSFDYVNEAFRVLKPLGSLIITELSWNLAHKEIFLQNIYKSGFCEIKLSENNIFTIISAQKAF